MRRLFPLLALAGCVSQGLPPGKPTPMTPSLRQEVIRSVTVSMKDPDSAKFSPKFQAVKSPEGVTQVCGMVNGKNSYGGYTGYQFFVGAVRPDGVFHLVGIGRGAERVCGQILAGLR